MPQKTRNLEELHSAGALAKVPVTKPLLALFLEHVELMKREFRQRRAISVLQNIKGTRVSDRHLRQSELNHKV